MSVVMGQRIAKELVALPSMMEQMLATLPAQMEQLAASYALHDHAFFLGRKYNVPVAREGALKLKELAYVHAESYPSGELKHGPLALIDDRFFSMVILPQDSVYDKGVSNLQELRARGGKAIVVTTDGNHGVDDMAEAVIHIPKTLEMLTPILAVLPLHLFAYYVAIERGCDIDQPRNLAKSVTVE
jgi:glucosamine--fructose-6-phosphate aminotransferase (isomerizing)